MANQQRYCAAANCDNAAEHLFKWPEHKNSTDLQRQAWTKFVCDKVKNFSLKSHHDCVGGIFILICMPITSNMLL